MAKTTSFILGDEHDGFIRKQVARGKYGSASEVMRAALDRLVEDDRKSEELARLLDAAEKSPIAPDGVFDRVLERLRKQAAKDRAAGRGKP